MTATITFGGLASGLDTNSIVDKLISVEKAPITTIQGEQSDLKTKISTLGTLVSKLQSVGTAVDSLSLSTQLEPVTATSSDPSRVTAQVDGNVAPGVYSLAVSKLASAQTSLSTGFDSSGAGAVGDGDLGITVGSGQTKTVHFDGSDSLADIAKRINDLGVGATASVVNDGKKLHLMITGTTTGSANAISFTESGASLGFLEDGATVVSADDASFKLNGVPMTRPTNQLTDVVPGLELGLQSVTPAGAGPTSINVNYDAKSVAARIQTFVNALDDVGTVVSGQLSYDGTRKGTDTLFGDTSVENLQRSLGLLVATSVDLGNGKSVSPADIGIDIDEKGVITFDQDKFNAAFSKDPSVALKLFTGDGTGNSGLGRAANDLIDTYANPADGALVAKQTGYKTNIADDDKRIQSITDSASALEDRLRAQFTAMEQAVALLQSQSSYLSQLTASLTGLSSASAPSSSSSSSASSSSSSSSSGSPSSSSSG